MKVINIQHEIIDYGVKLINPLKQWNITKGENIKIGILDTGIDMDHIDLKDNFKAGVNFTSQDREDFRDRKGHGTFCAGLIAACANNVGIIGVAPKASLYAIKVLDDSSRGNLQWLCQGIQWCINHDMDIINMSLGFHKDYPKLHDLLCQAYNNNIICIAAAGNNRYLMDAEYPAKYQEVIAISSFDKMKKLASFSTNGQSIELSAPGVDLVSTFPGNKYAQGSGSSFSAPLVTGAIALIISQFKKEYNRRMTYLELREFLYKYSEDLGIPGKDREYGYGFRNYIF